LETIKKEYINEQLEPAILSFILSEKQKQKERNEKKIQEQKQKEEWNRKNNNYPYFQNDKPSHSNYNHSLP